MSLTTIESVPKWVRILIVGAIVSGMALAYYSLTNGSEIVIDSFGEVHTVGGEVRLFLQKDKFYKGQLKLVETAINDSQEAWTDENNRFKEIDILMAGVEVQLEESKERLIREGRMDRPTPAELEAQKLRSEASKLEEAADELMRTEMWRRQLTELENIRSILKDKLK